MKKISFLTFALICIFANIHAQNYITRDGKKLKYLGNEIYLRGMAFGNLVWDDSYANTPNLHHSEADYQRLQDLGMNAIRFYMNYKTFENDATPYTYKQSGWNWIDQNIQWAKAHGVYLILNMHIPQGGFQSRCSGDALWTNVENQNRLVALWKEIANKYKNEPQIAGYDILNEPTPSGSIQNWSNLAQRIIDSIRKVDANHLIITERALGLGCDYSFADANNNYPQVSEQNMMYTVHMYDPFEYTHQNLSWAGTGDGGIYPDESIFTVPSDAVYATGNYSNPNITIGTTNWKYYSGTAFNVTVDSLLFGRVTFQCRNLRTGKVYFDDFIVQELNANNQIVDTVFISNPTSGNYWKWTENGTGTHQAETNGHNDAYSVSVTGNTAGYTVILPDFTFKVRKGYKYRISGWMKGDNILSGSTASFGTDFSYSPSKQLIVGRNYTYLANRIKSYATYIENLGFPVYFGEFGAARTCFVNNKGGEKWVRDCLNIFDSLGYHFTYHAYKESSFGLYDGWDLPVQENQVNPLLKTVFENYFSSILTIDDKSDFNESFKIFPNPVIDHLTIENSNNNAWRIVDLSGIEVIKGIGKSLNTSSLANGFYILEINNTRVKFQKIK